MIQLFSIPKFNIDTSKFSHALNGSIVTDFENRFCEYVGGKYAVGVNSCTNAIQYVFEWLSMRSINYASPFGFVSIPAVLPPVVYNALAISLGRDRIRFIDCPTWVGGEYRMGHDFGNHLIIADSAQEVTGGRWLHCDEKYICFYSFFPTKPCGGCDGGAVVTNIKELADWLRIATNNGMSQDGNSWDRKWNFPGYKSYLSSIQAYCADESLTAWDGWKIARMWEILYDYNKAFGLNNESFHLYRVPVHAFDDIMLGENIKELHGKGIACGVHYKPLFDVVGYDGGLTEEEKTKSRDERYISIPFHAELTNSEINKIVEIVKPYVYLHCNKAGSFND